MIPIVFFSCLAVVVVGIVLAIYNAGKMFKDFDNGDLDMGQGMVVQTIACGLCLFGGLGAFSVGIAWIIDYIKS